jgi:hypothetical protein
MGKFKWSRLGLSYTLADVDPPDAAAVERTVGVFRAAGLKTY